jgi:hypothetical protein
MIEGLFDVLHWFHRIALPCFCVLVCYGALNRIGHMF